MEKWVRLNSLNIPKHKWDKFRKLKLPARICNSNIGLYKFDVHYFSSMGLVNFRELSLRVGMICDDNCVNLVPVNHPSCWIPFHIDRIEVMVSEKDLAKLGCIMLSE